MVRKRVPGQSLALTLSFLGLASTVLLPQTVAGQPIAVGTRGATSHITPVLAPTTAHSGSSGPSNTATSNHSQAIKNLDLSSVSASLHAQNKTPLNILIGGTLVNGIISGGKLELVKPGQLVTAAQYAAVFEAMRGNQTLLLGTHGSATGGYMNLKASYAQNLTSLVVPKNVSVDAIGYSTISPLNVSGSVSDSGAIYLLQTSPGLSATLNAGSLNVAPKAILSGNLPEHVNSGSGIYASAGMNLQVAGTLQNNGTISTPGTLNITAAGDINNKSANTGSQSVISAQNVNIVSGTGNINNSGLIQAVDTLNINTVNPSTDLIINNNGGTLRALGELNPSGQVEQGTINIRTNGTNEESANSGVWGGALSATSGINMYGKNMVANVDSITGTINNYGSTAHITVREGDLLIGSQQLTGDPTYFNTSGPIRIQVSNFYSGDLAICASGDINVTGDATLTASGSIFLSAGYNISTSGGTSVNDISFSAGDSTNIIGFTGSTTPGGINPFSASSLSLTAQGGGVTLVSPTTINLNSGSITAPGNVLAIFGLGGFKAQSITAGGSIQITSASAGLGGTSLHNGTVLGSQPFVIGGSSGNITTTGSINSTSAQSINISTGGSFSSSSFIKSDNFVAGGNGGNIAIIAGSSLSVTGLPGIPALSSQGTTTGAGGKVQIQAGSIEIGMPGNPIAINVNGGNSGPGGNVFIERFSSGTLQLGASGTSGGADIQGAITANGGGVSSAGGTVTVTSFSGGINYGQSISNSIQVLGAGTGAGGNVGLYALGGDLTLSNGSISGLSALSLVASGNIRTSSSTAFALDESSSFNAGGSITMIAGATGTSYNIATNTLSVSGAGGTGSIDLSGLTGVNAIKTNSVTVANAHPGSAFTAVAGGAITLGGGSSNFTLDSSGSSTAQNSGDVTIVGGNGVFMVSSAITDINTRSGTNATGNVVIAAATPSLSSVKFINSVPSGTFSAGTAANAPVFTSSITVGGASISVTTGGGDITAFGSASYTSQGIGVGKPGGNITVSTSNNGATTGSITMGANPALSSLGIGNGGGGKILVSAAFVEIGSNPSQVSIQSNGGAASGSGGAGGAIIISTNSAATLNIGANDNFGGNDIVGIIEANAGDVNKGGSITIVNNGGGVTYGLGNQNALQVNAFGATAGTSVPGSIGMYALGSSSALSINGNLGAGGANSISNLALVATGDITTPGGVYAFNESSTINSGGNVLALAGANASYDLNSNTLTVNQSSSNTGSLGLVPSVIDTSTTAAGKAGGTFTAVAYGGSVVIGNATNTISTGAGSAAASNGNVFIVGSSVTNSYTVNTAGSGSNGSGTVTMAAGTPTLAGNITVVDGKVTSGGPFSSSATGATGGVTTAGISTAGGNVSLSTTSGAVTVSGSINTNGASGGGSGGSVVISGSAGVTVSGGISATGNGASNSGGMISISNTLPAQIEVDGAIDNTASDTSATAGSITLSDTSGSILSINASSAGLDTIAGTISSSGNISINSDGGVLLCGFGTVVSSNGSGGASAIGINSSSGSIAAFAAGQGGLSASTIALVALNGVGSVTNSVPITISTSSGPTTVGVQASSANAEVYLSSSSTGLITGNNVTVGAVGPVSGITSGADLRLDIAASQVLNVTASNIISSTSNSATITINADSLSFATFASPQISVGSGPTSTGTLTISPVTPNQSILIDDSGTGYLTTDPVNPGQLTQLFAMNLNIGSATFAGDITIGTGGLVTGASPAGTAPGAFNTNLNGGNFNTTQALSPGQNSLSINASGTLTIAGLTGGTGALTLSGASVTTTGAISISGALQLTATSPTGNIVLGGDLSGSSVSIQTGTTGTLSSTLPVAIVSTSAGIDVAASDVSGLLSGSTFSAASQTMTIRPTAPGENISVNGAPSGPSTLTLPAAFLASITASQLIIGGTDSNSTGDISVNSVGGTFLPTYDLLFQTSPSGAGSFTNNGTMAMGNQNLQVSVGGTVSSGTISSTALTLSLSGSSVQLNGSINDNFFGRVTLTATGASGTITQSSGNVTAATLIVNAGTGTVLIQNIDAPAIITSGTGASSITLTDTTAIHLNPGPITSTAGTGGLSITDPAGIDFLNPITTTGTLSLNGDDITIDAPISGAAVQLTGLTAGGTGSSVMVVSNNNNISSTVTGVTIASAAGQDLVLEGNFGNISAPQSQTISIASTDGARHPNIDVKSDEVISLGTAGNSGGTVTITTANGNANSSFILEGAASFGFPMDGTNVTVTSGNLSGNPGNLVVHPGGLPANKSSHLDLFISSSGTIANNGGPVDLGQVDSIVIPGGQLAIIASTNITLSNQTIDLSSGAGVGGSLLLLAGFNFTPLTKGGAVGPDQTSYTLSNATAGGFIAISHENINVFGPTGGGSILAIASAGQTNDGSISIDTINGTGGTGSGATLTMYGNGITVGNANLTGASGAGAVSLNATGSITIPSGTVSVQGGTLSGFNNLSFGAAAPNSQVSITTDQLSITNLSAGPTGTVTIAPNAPSSTVNVAGGNFGLQLPAASFPKISAQTVVIGTTAFPFALKVNGNLDLSAEGYSLQFLQGSTAGGFNSVGNLITLSGSASLTITSNGAANVGSVITAAGTTSITAARINVLAPDLITSNGITLQATSGLNGNISVNTADNSSLTATSAFGNVTITNTGNLTSFVTAAGAGQIGLTNNGNVTLGADIANNQGVTINLTGAGNTLSNAGLYKISSTASPITITADAVNLTGVNPVIDAQGGANGLVTIAPASLSLPINVAGGTGGLLVPASLLSAINATAVTIGSAGSVGGISVNGPFTVTGYNLSFLQNTSASNAGFKSAGAGNIITIGSNTLTVNVGGAVNLGQINSAGATINISGASITATAAVGSSADTTTLTTTNGSINGAGVVHANSLTLNAIGGSITSNTNASNISATAGGLASSSVNITNGSALTFTVPAVGSNGTVTLNNIGDVTLGNSINGPGGVTIALSAGNSLNNTGTEEITSNNSPINLSLDQFNLQGPALIDAGTGTVTISPVTAALPIILVGASGVAGSGLSFTEAQLSGISAQALVIGSPTGTGPLSIAYGAAHTLTVSTSASLLLEAGVSSFDSSNGTITVTGGSNPNASFGVLLASGNITVGQITNSYVQGGVSLQTNGTFSIINLGSVSGPNLQFVPNAHSISILAGTGQIANLKNLPATGLVLQPTDLGSDGGNVSVSASNLVDTLVTLDANVPVVGAGNGGIASYSNTATANFNPSSSNLILNVSGVNAGTAKIIAGGNLTFDASAPGMLILTATGDGTAPNTGNGASLVLSAGSVTTGNLDVINVPIGGISVAGNGNNGIGGNISLHSNSSTAFTIGATTANSINGTLNVIGLGGNGSISFSNSGGGITEKVQNFSTVNNLTFNTQGALAGTITIGTSLSAPGTISLLAGGTGAILAGSKQLTAPQIVLSSDTGAIGGTAAISVNTSTLSANTTGTGTVNVNNVHAGNLNLNGSSAGTTFVVSNNGDITTASISAGTSVTLKSTAATGNISIGGNITAASPTAGSVTLTATGSGKIDDAGAGVIQAKTVILNTGSGSAGIGDLGALQVAAASLTANTTGIVNLNNVGFSTSTGLQPISITAANPTANPFTLTSLTPATLVATLSNATSITVNTSAGNGAITLSGASLGSSAKTGSIILNSGAGSISGKAIVSTSGTVSLSSSSGNFGTSAAALKLSAPTVTLSTTSGLINLNDTSTGGIQVNGFATTGSATFVSASKTNTQFNGALSGASVVITDNSGSTSIAGTVTSAGSVTLVTGGTGSSSFGQIIANTGSITLTESGTGALSMGANLLPSTAATTISVTSSGTGITTNGDLVAGNSVTMKDTNATGAITLNGNVIAQNTSSGTVSLTGSGASATIVDGVNNAGASVQAKTVILTTSAGASIGGVSPLNLAAINLTANTTGGMNVHNLGYNLPLAPSSNGQAITLVASSASSINLLSATSVVVTPTLAAAKTINIDTSSGSLAGITLNGATLGGSSTTTLSLKTNSGNITGAATLTTSTKSGAQLNLISTGGNLGASATPLKLSSLAPNLSSASGVINISDLFTGATQFAGSINTTGAVSIATAGPTTLPNISASAITLKLGGTATTITSPSNVSLDAGSGTVNISAATANVPITVGNPSASGLNFTQAQLLGGPNNITAGTIILGSNTMTGGVTVNPTLSLNKAINLEFVQGAGSFSSSDISFTAGGSLSVSLSSGNIKVGSLSNTSGAVSLQTNGAASTITLTSNTLPQANSISLLAGTGKLAGLPSTGGKVTIQPSLDASNNGGSVFLSASNLSSFNFNLNVQGSGSGSGGTASYVSTSTAAYVPLQSQLQINASGVNAGNVVISTGGNLTFTTGNGVIVDTATGDGSVANTGNGASITLIAGNTSTGTLSIDTSGTSNQLNANGTGLFGNGGNITLGSNSSTPFVIIGSGPNSISGLPSVHAGGNNGTNGSITVNNKGGGITDITQALLNVNNLTFNTTGAAAGTILVGQNIGSTLAPTNSISLIVGGSGALNVSGTLFANATAASFVTLKSGTGAIGTTVAPITVITPNLSVNTSGAAVASVTDQTTGTLGLGASSGGSSLTVLSAGSINTSGALTATNSVTLASTSQTNANIVLNGSVTATGASGTVSISAAGSGNISDQNPGTDAIQAKTITFNAASGSLGGASALRVATAILNLNAGVNTSVNNFGLKGGALSVPAFGTGNFGGTFSLQSSTAVTLAQTLGNATSVSLDTSSGTGGITVNSLGGSSTGSISLSTAKGNISVSSSSTLSTSGTGSLTLQSTTGSIGSPTVPLKTNAATLSANSTSGLENINDVNTNVSGVTVSGLTTSGALTYTAGTGALATTFGTLSGGTVTLHLVGNNTFNGSLVAKTGALTITQSGGATNVNANMTANTTVNLNTSGTGISTAQGVIISAPTSVTLAAGAGFVSLGGAVKATSAAASVTITGASGISDLQAGADFVSAKTVTLNTTASSIGSGLVPFRVGASSLAVNASGSSSLDNLGYNSGSTGIVPLTLTAATTSSSNSFSLQSSTAVTVSPTLSNAKSISIDTSAGSGGITLNGASLGSVNTTTAINLSTGSGSITGRAQINSGNSLLFSSTTGNFGAATKALSINAPSVSANTSSGLINLTDSSSSAINVAAIATTGPLTFTTTGSGGTTFNALTASSITLKTAAATKFNGNINAAQGAFVLTESGTNYATDFNLANSGVKSMQAATNISVNTVGSTTFADNVIITANPNAVSGKNGTITVTENAGELLIGNADSLTANGSTAGSITLLEKTNSGSPSISVGQSTQFSTNLTAKSATTTSFPLPGQISIVVGASVPSVPTGGGASHAPNNVTEFDGAGPKNVVYWGNNPITSAGSDVAVIGNSAIVFSAGTQGSITLGSGTTFIADPPGASSISAPTLHINGLMAPVAQQGELSSHAARASEAVQVNAGLAGSVGLASSTVRNTAIATPLLLGDVQNSANISGLIHAGSRVSQAASSIEEASFSNNEEFIFGISQNSDFDAQIVCAKELGVKALDATIFAERGQSKAKKNVVTLQDGNVLFAPSVNTTVQTPFGNVDIDARSLALLVVSRHGVAIYNMDDEHRDAVKMHVCGHTLTIAPGRNAYVTHRQVKAFELINPIEAVGYRRLTDYEIDGGFRVFRSEFSIPSAITSIKALRVLMNSQNVEAKRLTLHMLKTAAAVMQTQAGAEAYQQLPHPRMAAYAGK